PAGVAVVAVLDDGNVDVEDVSGLQNAVAGNAMTDLMIHRGADRLRERLVAGRRVVQRRGDGLLLLDDEVVAQAVELSGRDARLDPVGDEVEHLGGELAGDAHVVDLFGRLQVYRHAPEKKSEG